MNIPNYLTLLRIILIPIFVLVWYMPGQWHHGACAAIFMLACFTDWLDGYLARYLQQISALGRFLDPVADKLVVAVALVLLVSEPHMPYLAIPAAVIVGREIIISALREWMAELGKRAHVAVSYVGKVKTTLQMLALTLLIAYHPGSGSYFGVLGYLLLYVAAGLTLWTMCMYLRVAWPEFSR